MRTEEEIEKEYNKIKKKGIDFGIDWSAIEYAEFVYELRELKGTKTCDGKLYFTSGENTYYAKTESIHNGNGYR